MKKSTKSQRVSLFLNKIFNGSMNLMLMNFIKTKNLSGRDIEELKKILDNAHK